MCRALIFLTSIKQATNFVTIWTIKFVCTVFIIHTVLAQGSQIGQISQQMTEISGADQLMSPYCTNAFSIFVDFISTEIFFTEEKV